jgi:sialate O-acetylesterase
MKVGLHGLFGDGMVMQRGTGVPVWGHCVPGVTVAVRFLGKSYAAAADDAGKWRVVLDPMEAGGPYEMRVVVVGEGTGQPETAERDEVVVKDIYVGDVWLCSGQSNMELSMVRLRDEYPDEWKEPNPLVREFRVPLAWNFKEAQDDVLGSWLKASPETLENFSGTAWFFAQYLYAKYRVPVGLIVAAIGGSPIESLMSKEALASDELAGFPHKAAESELYADDAFREKNIRESEEAQKRWEDTVWQSDEGLSGEWYKSDLDDSAWNSISLPGFWTTDGLEDYCGVVWFRRNIVVPSALLGKPVKIWLGTIVDADTVYVNEREVGSIGYRYPPRKYVIPEGVLHEGRNQITIKVTCNNGNGGWTPDKPFRIFSGISSENETIELKGMWKYKTTAKVQPRPQAFFIQRQPCGLFNAMIAPLLPYPVQSVVWYQGESNDKNPQEYGRLFSAMIRDWRSKKRSAEGQLEKLQLQKELPFLFVQLPIFGDPTENTEDSRWAILREAQADALRLPNTGMAVALDLGEWNDLHPLNKKGVGYRLFLAAEAVIRRQANTAPGPMLANISRQGGKLVLTFDKCGSGLAAKEAVWTSVVDKEGKQTRIKADITGPCELTLDTTAVPQAKWPLKILYAWADNPKDRQLYNSEDLPAVPFRASVAYELHASE